MVNKTDLANEALLASPTSSVLAQRSSRNSKNRQWLNFKWAIPYIFLLPFLLLFLMFFVVPFIYDVYNSFFSAIHSGGLGLSPPKIVWTGFDNYSRVLHDASFWGGFGRVLIFGLIQIPIQLSLALIIALLMDSAIVRFRRFFRLAAFVPYAVPSVVAVILWSYFYTPDLSPITHIFTSLNLTAPDFLGQNTVLWSIGNIATWEYTGYNMIIFFSALQAIPQELYESGRLDGLSELGLARYIKIPLIVPALILGLTFSLIGTIQLFNEPEILKGVSGAINSSYTPNIYAYNQAIIQTNFYYGGAIAAVLGVITFIFSFFFINVTQRQSGGA